MLPFLKRNATETIIQKPISLASSLLHAPAIVTDICVLNKRIFSPLITYICTMNSKLRKEVARLC